MNLGLCCPLLLTYICWVIDAIREEKQAHQAQCYLEEGILEGAQHQQLKLFPEVGRGLGPWTHKPPTPRRPSSSLTGLHHHRHQHGQMDGDFGRSQNVERVGNPPSCLPLTLRPECCL